MNYKEENVKVYDNFSRYWDEKFRFYSNEIIKGELDFIVNALPSGAKMLDLGSGPGNHALFFQKHGIDVLCMDISDKMLKICRKKGLKTIKMDFEKINFHNESFDCVFAYTSLLHIPKKNVLPVLSSLHRILKKDGYLGISFKE